MAADDAKLEAQAQAMAEKALEKLPEAARAAKIEKVKEGILKRLKAQAAPAPPAGGAPPAGPPGAVRPPVAAPPGAPGAAGLTASSASSSAPAARQPPPPGVYEPLPGILMCGEEPWFADPRVRKALQDKVVAAHAAQKILVGPPLEEIRRICPGGGRVLGAGAVLRLGGAHHGGYGETDIQYAYRQLSRALHPDKNQGIPEAADAFKRLSEASDELKQGLAEARQDLRMLCEAMGGSVTPAMLERPQEAHFAEASRLLSGVLGLAGEGEVPAQALPRAALAFVSSSRYHGCEAQALLSMWYDAPHLLDGFSHPTLRTAYDCSPKHLRAQFLCALQRATLVEERRFGGLRTNWQAVIANFPELLLWRELREKLKQRASGRASKWDSGAVPGTAAQWSDWATTWRDKIREVLAIGINEALPSTSAEVRKLTAGLWKDFAEWASSPEVDAKRQLALFAGGAELEGGSSADWAFVPASDLLLVLGEGIVGITAEGVFLEALQGAPEPPAKPSKGDGEESKGEDKDKKQNGPKDAKSKMADLQAQMKDFDWEKAWRQRAQVSKWRSTQRRAPTWQRGHSPVGGASSSRSRGRRRGKKRRSTRSSSSRSGGKKRRRRSSDSS